MKKSLISLALAVVLTTALAITTFAAQVEIDFVEFIDESVFYKTDDFGGWVESSMTLEMLAQGKYLVFEIQDLKAEDLYVVHSGDGNSWGWIPSEKIDIAADGLYKDGKLTIDLTNKKYVPSGFFSRCFVEAYISVLFVGEVASDLPITKVTLFYGDDVPGIDGGGNTGGGSAKTGDTNLLITAAAVLALAAFGFVVLRKRVKV